MKLNGNENFDLESVAFFLSLNLMKNEDFELGKICYCKTIHYLRPADSFFCFLIIQLRLSGCWILYKGPDNQMHELVA